MELTSVALGRLSFRYSTGRLSASCPEQSWNPRRERELTERKDRSVDRLISVRPTDRRRRVDRDDKWKSADLQFARILRHMSERGRETSLFYIDTLRKGNVTIPTQLETHVGSSKEPNGA